MSDRFEVSEAFRFVGRTFEEYCRLLGLDPVGLSGRSVLDCPGGPGSFSAVTGQFTDRVLAVDPMYGRSLDTLERVCLDAIQRTVEQLREKHELFVWDEYDDPETRGRYLRAAAERFLADYAQHPGRYVAAGLPNLPFESNSFDLVLSANFLFLYDDRLDEAFHAESLLELARVASEEVRLFPLHSLDRDRSRLVDPVVEQVRDAGLSVRFEPVPYEFQPGATETLVVTPPDS
ncbi:MAG: class I SAM-dependent methyltransferase [Halovenus sp.]